MERTKLPRDPDRLARAYMTTREVAALLHVKERKIYDLAASGDIPGTRAMGKWLFERAAIEAWLSRHGNGADPRGLHIPNVILGSHDPLLEWAIRESGSGLAMFLDGSRDGLQRFDAGEGIAAGLHLHEGGEAWNLSHVRDTLTRGGWVLVGWAWRQRGLVVAADNPLGIAGVTDLGGRRLASRQQGAGAQLLLGNLLSAAGLGEGDVTILPPARTEADAALAVLEGEADAAFGLQCLARQYRLGFVPVIRERFDLLVSHAHWFEEPMQRLMAFTQGEAFARKAAALTGYDLTDLGKVQLNSGP